MSEIIPSLPVLFFLLKNHIMVGFKSHFILLDILIEYTVKIGVVE